MSIQYTVLKFKPTTFRYESPPITTSPGLLLFITLACHTI